MDETRLIVTGRQLIVPSAFRLQEGVQWKLPIATPAAIDYSVTVR